MSQKIQYSCQECGLVVRKWMGQCNGCQAWNSLVEEIIPEHTTQKRGYAGAAAASIHSLTEITTSSTPRTCTQLDEFDRVLGGGLVTGSVILLGGEPGIGKSTLLLRVLKNLVHSKKCLYLTGEESLQQVQLRAQRIGMQDAPLRLTTSTQVEELEPLLISERPDILVVDSVQTLWTETVSSAPGSVAQVRESAARLVQLAKRQHISIFLVGHVNKEGALAGPRVLEHMVDTVLYFESEQNSRVRTIRAVKNRFGAVNELAFFVMDEQGLKPMAHPSRLFLPTHAHQRPGSVVTVTWEGSRPVLAEIQALTDTCYNEHPRRVGVGIDVNRLIMGLAILHRHAGLKTFDQNVFVNVVGGLRLNEPAADLAVLLAVASSILNQPLPAHLAVFGEVGLTGELRPVGHGIERCREAHLYGFNAVLCPVNNIIEPEHGVKFSPIKTLEHALQLLWKTPRKEGRE